MNPFANRSRLLAAAAFALALATDTRADDPPVPPGRDPGGIMVAVVAQGFDYTRPDIAARLARDGEGEIVGFDFVANDRTPYDGQADGDGSAVARTILAKAPGVRLALVRASDQRSVGRALSFIAKSPARVALIVSADDRDAASRMVEQAARSLERILFVVVVAPKQRVPEGAAPPSPSTPENLIVATGEAGAENRAGTVPVLSGAATLAAARLAASAARIVEAEPSLTGAEIARRVAAEAGTK